MSQLLWSIPTRALHLFQMLKNKVLLHAERLELERYYSYTSPITKSQRKW